MYSDRNVTAGYPLGRALLALGVVGLLAGCAGPARMTATGVTRKQALTALWENGRDRTFQSFWKYTERVWEDVSHVDKPRVALTYKIDEFLGAIYGRDIVTVEQSEPNAVSLSLLCERKSIPFNLLWGVPFPYGRKVQLERSIMFNTARDLHNAGASISWEGPWKPRNMPVVVARDGSLWIAYTDAPLSVATEYLEKNDYKQEGPSDESTLYFQRDLDEDPDFDVGLFVFLLILETWESRERVVLKLVGQEAASPGAGLTVVVGASSVGTHNRVHAGERDTVDVGPMLRKRVIDNIATAAAVRSKNVRFADPAPWIEPMKRLSLE